VSVLPIVCRNRTFVQIDSNEALSVQGRLTTMVRGSKAPT
jgi:hypothetical protein